VKSASLDDLIAAYRDAAQTHGAATKSGDYKTGNKASDRIAAIYAELRRRGEDAQRELTRRGVAFTPPPAPEEPTPVGWPLWAVGAAVLTVLSVLVIAHGWGPRPAAVFVLPAALCLGMTVRRLMGR